jgi:ribosomal protein L19
MTTIIDEINNEQMNNDIPDFGPGDTVVVQVKIKEGTRERLQAYEGVVSLNVIAAYIQRLQCVRFRTAKA